MNKLFISESLLSNSKALFVFTSFSFINATIGAYGLYWLKFGGIFAHEGWYFVALCTYISPIFLPVFLFYFIWPKPVKRGLVLAFAGIPYIVMLICLLFFMFKS